MNVGTIIERSDYSRTWFWRVGIFVVHLLGYAQLFATPWTAAPQASLSFAISKNLFKLMSIEVMMPSNYLILCRTLLLLPLIFPSIRVFSSELALHISQESVFIITLLIRLCWALGAAWGIFDLPCDLQDLQLPHVGSSSLTRDLT